MNTLQVELIYEKTCPNIEAARRQLLRAFAETGITPCWREWDVGSTDAPSHIHGYGSPTILVNHQDVSGHMSGGDDNCCRVYLHGKDSNKGVPPLDDIVNVLESMKQTSQGKTGSDRRFLNGAMLPAMGVALLPKLACPACWPAYAGLLSSLGIGFIDYTPYLLPLTSLFLVIALAALTYGAERRHGYWPLLVGIPAAATLLIGKFQYDSDAAMYIGIGLLVLASLWNTWPKSRSTGPLCPACDTTDAETMRPS